MSDTSDRTLVDSDNTKGTTGTTCICKHYHYLEETWGQRLPPACKGEPKNCGSNARGKRKTAHDLWEVRSVRQTDVVLLNSKKDCWTWRCWDAGLKCSLSLRKQFVWGLISLGGFQWRPELMSALNMEEFVDVYKRHAKRDWVALGFIWALSKACVCIWLGIW